MTGVSMRRVLAVMVSALVSVTLLAPGPADAEPTITVVADELLGGKRVESWGACEIPGGWVVVHHDGYTGPGGEAVGMRLFQGTDATAPVVRRWSRYSPVTGLAPDRHDCVSADFDGNGLIDFYVTGGRGSENQTKAGRANELWLQIDPGIYRNRAKGWGVQDVCGRSHYAATADFNADGLPDIYVGNAAPRVVANDPCDAIADSESSHLYLNAGNGFTDATSAWGLSGTNGGVHCAQAGQFIGTTAPDLIVCRDQGLLVLENSGTGFVDRRASLGIPTTNWKQAAIGDVTLDGVPDLVTATYSTVQVRSGVSGSPVSVFSGDSVHGVGVNPSGDIYVLRSNPYTDQTNPADVVLVRDTDGWIQAPVPGAKGLGDSVMWLEGPQAWLVGNGVADRLGTLQLVSTTTIGQ